MGALVCCNIYIYVGSGSGQVRRCGCGVRERERGSFADAAAARDASCGGVAMRLDFLRWPGWPCVGEELEPGWVRAGGVCARSGALLSSRAVRTTRDNYGA